ncbi:MAG: hypothetical protein ACYC4F_01270 [Armatimonadota bacterium]
MFQPISVEEYRAMDYRTQQSYLEEMQEDWMKKNNLKHAKGTFCVTRLIARWHKQDKRGKCGACDLLSRSSVIDHPYMFKKRGRSVYGLDCIVVHPYNMSDHDVQELEAICNRFGLEYEVRPTSESWYNQYGTYMVIIRRKSALRPDMG